MKLRSNGKQVSDTKANIRQVSPLPLKSQCQTDAERLNQLKELQKSLEALPKQSIYARNKLRMVQTSLRLLSLERTARTQSQALELEALFSKLKM
jgi:hypothetical protein